MIKLEDLKHEMSVSCTIYNKVITDAKISINDNNDIYICHNEQGAEGDYTNNLLDYRYSYVLTNDNFHIEGQCENLKIIENNWKIGDWGIGLPKVSIGTIEFNDGRRAFKILEISPNKKEFRYRKILDGKYELSMSFYNFSDIRKATKKEINESIFQKGYHVVILKDYLQCTNYKKYDIIKINVVYADFFRDEKSYKFDYNQKEHMEVFPSMTEAEEYARSQKRTMFDSINALENPKLEKGYYYFITESNTHQFPKDTIMKAGGEFWRDDKFAAITRTVPAGDAYDSYAKAIEYGLRWRIATMDEVFGCNYFNIFKDSYENTDVKKRKEHPVKIKDNYETFPIIAKKEEENIFIDIKPLKPEILSAPEEEEYKFINIYINPQIIEK